MQPMECRSWDGVACRSRRIDRYTVVVRNLVLMCSIGIRRAERDRPQRVRVSVELTATPEAGFPGEDRRRVINYEKIVAAIREIAALRPYRSVRGLCRADRGRVFCRSAGRRMSGSRSRSSTFSPMPRRSARSSNAARPG